MAVPKRKTSKARKNSRRSSVWKLKQPTMEKCSNCGAYNLHNRVCSECGHKDGKEVIEVKD